MKSKLKIFGILLITLSTLINCKGEAEASEANGVVKNDDSANESGKNGIVIIGGEFVYFADAAVLQTPTGVYGIVINEKMHELNESVKQYKENDTDFVPVTVKGKISPKPVGTEGWDYNIEIIEIVKVDKPNPNRDDVIKISN